MNKKLTNTDKIIVAVGTLFIVVSWIYAIFYYNSLPDKIVAHMDLEGNVNRYDSKNTIWFLLSLFTVLSGFFYWISDKTTLNNLRIKDPKINRRIMLLTIPYLGILVLLLVILMIQKTLEPTLNTNWFMYAFLGLTVLLVAIMIVISYKNIKK